MNSPIDPNDLIINSNLLGKGLNGMPDLSKMHLFVELTAQRREGSVLVSSGAGTTSNTTLNAQDSDVKINMMGFDQDTGQYTTRWSRNFGDTKTNFEGFGITDININVNSSYVPTVDIEFVDIRGSSLFTFGTKSPYSVFFSFPPPIWNLTVKGYYGLALTYTLHFVRQTTKFDAQTGNFYISASFVGQKYAPLTDVLFKYIDVVPLMNEQPTDAGINLDPAQPPKNTRELIIKAQKLYDDLEKFKTESTLAKEADQFRTDFYTAKSLLVSINSAHSQMDTQFQNLTDLYIKNNDVQGKTMFERTTLDNYDLIIRKSSQTGLTIPKEKLLIATEYNKKSNSIADGPSTDLLNRIITDLTSTKKILIDQAANINGDIKNGDILDPTYVDGSGFVTMDITGYYLKAYKDILAKQKQFETKQDAYRSEVNKISVASLGRVPTIKFIFELLCNDVDKFFSKLKNVGSLGEKHHAKFFNKIVDNNESKKQKISPFPLVIKKGSVVTDKNLTEGSGAISRDERAYPAEIFIDIPSFPEVDFVESFITTYLNIVKSEEILDLKNGVDEQGNNKWMPINPLDSAINGRISAISPYYSKFNPIPELISEILNRFYIVTQFSYDQFFYHNDSNAILNFFGVDSKQLDLLTFIAKGEAANIVNSITDSNLLNALSVQANTWKQGIALKNDNFYDVLKNNVTVKAPGGNNVNIYNTFQGSLNKDFIYAPNGTSFLTLNGQIVTKDRRNPNYKGFELLTNGKPSLRTPNNDGSETGSENAVDKFLDRYSTDTLRNFLFSGDKPAFDSFTKQNIMYVKDGQAEDDEFDSDFIKDGSWFTSPILTDLLRTNSAQRDQNAPVILAKFLSAGGNFFKTVLTDPDPKITNNVKAYMFGTLFGRVLPYFDLESKINQKFAFPAIIEIPRFAHLHMGALSYFYTTGATISGEDEIFYFNDKYGDKFTLDTRYGGKNGDATQQIQLISATDYNQLIHYFTGFTNSNGEDGYSVFQNKLIAIINEVNALNLTNKDDKFTAYYNRLAGKDLKSSETDYSKSITGKLTRKEYLLNYTQITFYPTNQPVDEFTPLLNINNTATQKATNDNYFGLFFTEIIKLIEDRKKALRKIEDKFQSSIEDNDIKTQCYYSFKSISDRWVLGFGEQGIMGKTNTPLIDDFRFIDRAGNDISEKVVIDFRPIIEMSKDFDISVFTVMSRILALNGFEFFPLQNFIDFSNTNGNAKFDDVFKISSSQKVQIKSSPKFVCMYVGGTSSQLDDGAGDFDDDGIQKLESVVDFANSPTQAFKVSFAKQNQSIFTNIELSTNEHKETNESLAILSEIAQDNSTSSPVPKGQNLFSTYEQRSYTCKVDMLGDIMIQPTQYFVLENVPMFRGAYLILRVMHNITGNFMKTSFEGVRIRKVPQPFVRDFATATGVKGGSADAHLTDPNVIGNAFNNNTVNGVNPITNDQTSRLLSPK